MALMALSELQKIEVDIEKFFKATGTDVERFCSAFTSLFRKAPSALQAVENFTGEVAPMIEGAVAIADPFIEPEVAAGLATLESGLAAIQAAAVDANSGNSLLQNLENFAADVPRVLGAIQVKNPNLKAAVVRIVNFVTNETKVILPAVENWIKQIAASRTPATSGSPSTAAQTA